MKRGKAMTLEQTIANMLTENTGTHMLDSGGANGRAWQRNAGKSLDDWRSGPTATLEIYMREWNGKPHVELMPTVDVFHKLTSGVVQLDELCKEYNARAVGDWGSDLNGVSHSNEEWLTAHGFSWDFGQSGFNTCNWENNLSQVLQGNFIERDGEKYVLLQVHGGADVRGGYTDAKLFKLSHYAEEYNLFDDHCGFGVEGPEDGISLSWHGEWINGDGGCLDDDEALAFATAAGASLDVGTVTIEGDGYFDI